MKSRTWSKRVANKLSDVIILPLGPRLKLRELEAEELSTLFHNALVIDSIANINIWNIGEVCNGRVEIEDVCVFIVVCHIGREALQYQLA